MARLRAGALRFQRQVDDVKTGLLENAWVLGGFGPVARGINARELQIACFMYREELGSVTELDEVWSHPAMGMPEAVAAS